MPDRPQQRIVEVPALHGRVGVFRDRAHAGNVLASLLADYRGSNALVLAIPAGGVPVAVPLAHRLALALDVAVVSKITLPWSTEAGYGAVAFDGSVELNTALIAQLGLSDAQVQDGIRRTRDKVARRVMHLRGTRPAPGVQGGTAILVDDGLASGFTMRAAIAAVRKIGARTVAIAVPTAHVDSIDRIADRADQVFCANLRAGWQFAVADAYERWADVDEDTARRLLVEAGAGPVGDSGCG